MSYILDALRKADAERRGVPLAPGQTEPAVLVDADPDADLPPAAAHPWAWVAGGAGLAVAAAVGWTVWRGAAGEPAVAPEAVAVAEAPAPAPTPAAEPVAGEGGNADALPNFPPPLPQEVQKPAVESGGSAGAGGGSGAAAAGSPGAKAANLPGTPAARPAPPPGIAPAPAPGAAPKGTGTDRVYNLAELPEDVRRDMPRLNVGGAMYSERPADRMVVLNGQVFHEGDEITRDVRLRQIKLKTAVVEFRGYRVEMGY